MGIPNIHIPMSSYSQDDGVVQLTISDEISNLDF